MTADQLARLIPAMIEGIKQGADIVQRLSSGDQTAAQEAADWIGVTISVENAIKSWEDSKPKA